MITTQINEQGEMPNNYPLLMRHVEEHSLVVLFTKPKIGTVVSVRENSVHQTGDWCDYWDMVGWEPFPGTLELRNT